MALKPVQASQITIFVHLESTDAIESTLTDYSVTILPDDNDNEAFRLRLLAHTSAILLTDDLTLCQTFADDNIAVIAVVPPDDINTALNAGATDYVLQPLTPARLQHRVDAVYERLQKHHGDRLNARAITAMGDAIMIVDQHGACLDVINKQSTNFITPPETLIGQSLDAFMPAESAAEIRTIIQQVLDTHTPRIIDYYVHINGDDHWFSASLSPLDDTSVLWVKRNINDRKQTENALRESERRYRQFFDAATDGILLIDIESGAIKKANRQAAKMLEYPIDKLESLHISDIEAPSDMHDTAQFGTVESNGNFITEAIYRRSDGKPITVETSSRVITYDQQSMILCFVRDITQRKQALIAEYEQRKLAEALRDTAAAFNNTLELDDVLDTILHTVERVISSDAANIMLIDDNIARIVRHNGYDEHGFDDEEITRLAFNVTSVENLRTMCEMQQPVMIANTEETDFKWEDTKTARWIKSYVGVPIVVSGNEVVGFINLDSDQPDFFTQLDSVHLKAFADQAAIAIQNARLFEQVQTHAQELEQRVQERTREVVAANQALRQQIQQRQLIEDQLQEERTLLQTLIDNIPDAIYVKDTEGRIMQANQAALDMARAPTLQAAIGKTNYDLFDSDFAKHEHQRELDVIRTQTPQINDELWYRDWDGNKHCALASRIPLFDNDDNIIGIIGILRDITELKAAQQKLQDERNLLRTLIDTIPDLIYIKDKDGDFLMANKATQHLAGGDVTEMTHDNPLTNLTPYANADEQVLTTGMPIINEQNTVHLAENDPRHYLVTKLPMHDDNDNIVGLIGVGRDITELRRTQDQLEQVLTSARCLLWSATAYKDDTNTLQWDVTIANEAAAHTFLPVDMDTHDSYTDAWLDSILPQDQRRRQYVFKTHAEFGMRTYSQEFRCQLADGSLHWLVEDVQIKQVDATHWELVGVCTDITTRKNAEQTLQQINERLENRVRERTKELWQANTELKREIIERKRAEEAERRQRIIAEGLRDSVAMLNRHLERDAVLEYLLDAIRTVVPHDAANIMLLQDATDTAEIVRMRGYTTDITGKQVNYQQWVDYEDMIDTHEPSIISNVTEYDAWQGIDNEPWICSHLTVPIPLEGEIIGFLHLESGVVDSFTAHHAEWLKVFANQAGNAIRNARMVEEIRQHASTLAQRVQERTAELESEQAQLRAILDAMRDGVIFYDLNNEPQYINDAMVEITGYSADDWLDGTAQNQLPTASPEEQADTWRKINQNLQNAGYWEGEAVLRHKDGHTFNAEIRRTQVQNQGGRRIGLVSVLRDISQEKKLEAQKARFIASASHELRTPIANMKTRLYLIQRRPDKLNEHIEVLRSVVNLMQNLVEDMFDISRFERGTMAIEREPVTLNAFIQETVQYHQPEAERQDIQLTTTLPDATITAHIDPYRMTQVISNLIGNALNHTTQNGSINVQLTDQPDDDTVTIIVSDTGTGIPEDHLPHLFKPFFRGDENDNRGAGLGLSISSEIVKLHGGSLEARSTVGEGSQFIITVPKQSRD